VQIFTKLLLGTVVLPTLLSVEAWANPPPIPWRQVLPDLEVAEVSFPRFLVLESSSVIVRTSLSRFRVGVIRAGDLALEGATVQELVLRTGAAFGVNGSFFEEGRRAIGLLATRGIVHQRPHMGGTLLNGIFVSSKSGLRILPRTRFSSVSILDGLQAGPLLIQEGRSLSSFQDRADRRSAVCIDKEERLVFFATSSRVLGLSLGDLQEFLLGLGCKDALNLDGGGSTQLFLSTRHSSKSSPYELNIEGEDPVPSAIVLFPLVD
jgi:exopolysaccharide biosynthesis protein